MIREKSNNARKEFAELMNKHERSKRNIGQEVPAEIVKKGIFYFWISNIHIIKFQMKIRVEF